MKQFIIILLVLACSPYMKAQSDVDYVKKQYSEVYSDIYNRAALQTNEVAQQEKIIQEQVYAFLELAEGHEKANNAALAEALVRWSTKGYEDYNQNIIEDSTIQNPFPQLRCDWVLARLHYKRTLSGIDKFGNSKSNKSQTAYANYDRDHNYHLHYSPEYLELLEKRYEKTDTEVTE